MKYLEDNGVEIKGENCNWGNFDDVAVDGLTGYYTNVKIGNTDGFKNCSELESQKTDETVDGSNHILLTTGASEKVKKLNLYDVAGNLWELTEESGYRYNGKDTNALATDEYNTFVSRGSGFNCGHSSISTCYRAPAYANEAATNTGFRVVLYIK